MADSAADSEMDSGPDSAADSGADSGADPAAGAATCDRLLGGRVVLRQPAAGYRIAVDPVLLAAAVPAESGERVVDAGCGAGAAALCLAARVPGCRVVGLDLQPELVALARANATANGMADRITVVEGDLATPPAALPEALAAGSFDHAMANPPFLPAAAHTPPPNPAKELATQEGAAGLAAWLDFAHRMLKPRGRLTLIHRADRVDEVCALLRPRFGAVTLLPLWPRAGEPARRIIVRARKGVRSPAALLPGLVLHEPDGRFTAAAEAVLREGAALGL